MAKQGKYSRIPAPAQQPQASPAEEAGNTPEQQPLTPGQKAWEVTKTVFTYIIMALAICMMIFTAVSILSFDRNDRDIFGYKFFIVRSDSMSATDFSAGDLVVVKEVDPGILLEGDIIAFTSEDPASLGETFTHKIRSITADDFGQRTFVTYGTTTGVDDVYPVSQSKVLGKYQFSIANMGTFFAFMKTPMGYIFCIGLPFLLMLFIQGGSMITSARQLYKEKTEAVEMTRRRELIAQQKVIEKQRQAMKKLFVTVNALEERVKALEKAREEKA